MIAWCLLNIIWTFSQYFSVFRHLVDNFQRKLKQFLFVPPPPTTSFFHVCFVKWVCVVCWYEYPCPMFVCVCTKCHGLACFGRKSRKFLEIAFTVFFFSPGMGIFQQLSVSLSIKNPGVRYERRDQKEQDVSCCH